MEYTKSEIARLMLDWEETNKKLMGIEGQISEGVLELGETFDVGDIRASFANPRKSYHWEESGKVASQDIIDNNTKHIPEQIIPAEDEIYWQGVCLEAKIVPTFKITSEAKVTVKMK